MGTGSLVVLSFVAINALQIATAVWWTPSATARFGLILTVVYWLGAESLCRTRKAADVSSLVNEAKADAAAGKTQVTKEGVAGSGVDKGSSLRSVIFGVSLMLLPLLAHVVDPTATKLPGGMDLMFVAKADAVLPNTVPTRVLIAIMFFAVVIRWYSMALMGDRFTRVLRVHRNQDVITSGPYGYVRHPGYLANGIIYTAGGLLVSGNLLVCVLCLVGFGISWGKRIAAEEAMLQKHVAGYKSYMKDTRYRLVPGVW